MKPKRILNFLIIGFAIICLILVFIEKLNLKTAVFLFLALIGSMYILGFALKPILTWRNNQTRKIQKQLDVHKQIALKQGKRDFPYMKKHTVWATKQQVANKIGDEKIKPLLKKNPRKEYYFISSVCNNLDKI